MDTMESPRSPKRRRILASINPPMPSLERDLDGNDNHYRRPSSASRSVSESVPAPVSPSFGPAPPPAPGLSYQDIPTKHTKADSGDPDARQRSEPRTTKFRFKSPRRHRSSCEDDDHRRRHRHRHRHRDKDKDQDPDGDSAKDKDREGSRRNRNHRRRSRSRSHSPSSSTRQRHRHHHRSKRHHDKPTSPKKQEPPQEPEPNDPFEQPIDPEVAFRESLFDAMADDEGAAYWEGVYGQPIHIYPPDKLNPRGELERMTDEQYAAHVRQKMWEKTHAGLLEEREKRKRQAEERARKDDENRRIQIELERSLKRGEQRRKKRVWRDKWEGYVDRWAKWDGKTVREIPWPEEGKKEVDTETLRAFFVNGLNLEELGEKEFAARLKDERVRWHPDKMQQRLGGTVDEDVMRDVTAIFQVIDALWNDTRKSL